MATRTRSGEVCKSNGSGNQSDLSRIPTGLFHIDCRSQLTPLRLRVGVKIRLNLPDIHYAQLDEVYLAAHITLQTENQNEILAESFPIQPNTMPPPPISRKSGAEQRGKKDLLGAINSLSPPQGILNRPVGH